MVKPFVKLLKDVEPKPVYIYIDSLGGDIFEGVAIYNAIKNYKGKIRAYISGNAYGIASILACACDEIYMKKGVYFVISEPKMFTMGSDKDSIILDKIRDILAGIWAEKSEKTEDEIFKMMELETWLTDIGAQRDGFVDFIYE